MNNAINILKGPDRVRKRPAVVFGSDGIEGAQAAAKSLLDIFATEAMLGYCTSISVIRRGEEITVSGNDRGLYLGQNASDCSEAWQSIFCELYPAPQEGPAEEEYHFDFFNHHHGLLYGEQDEPSEMFLPDSSGINDLCLLQFVCAKMNVTVIRDSIRSELSFRRGYNIGGIRNTASSSISGTTIQFVLDSEVFSDVCIASMFFVEALKTYSMLVPGLHTRYVDSIAGEDESFCFRNGISEFVQKYAISSYAPIFTSRIAAIGKDRYNRREYQAIVNVALCFVPNGCSLDCYHNLRYLQHGGTHLNEITSSICREINSCFSSYIKEKTGCPNAQIQQSEINEHLILIVETWCSKFATEWGTGARQSICNTMIKDMAHDIFCTEFSNYVQKNKALLRDLIDHIL